MLKLDSAKFENSNTAENIIFSNGVSHLPFLENSLFDNLKIRFSDLIEGSFVANDVSVLDDKDFSLFSIDINSKVFCLTAVYLVKNIFKKDLLKIIKNDLISLRDMPLDNESEIKNKIERIFNVIKRNELSYVLIDFNNEINAKNIALIGNYLDDSATYIVLDKKIINEESPIINEESPIIKEDKCFIETSPVNEVKEVEIIKQKEPIESVVQKEKFSKVKKERKPSHILSLVLENLKSFFKSMGVLLKIESLFFLFLTLFAGFSVFGLFFFPRLFALNKTAVAVILLIDAVVFFILNFYLVISSYNSLAKKKETIPHFEGVFGFVFFLFNLVGIAIALILSFVFVENSILLEKDSFDISYTIASYVVSGIFVILPFVARFISKLFNKKK